jgi:hypothetical protein
MRPKLVAIKVSGCHLIPVIMRASSRGRRRHDFEASIISAQQWRSALRVQVSDPRACIGKVRPGGQGELGAPGVGGGRWLGRTERVNRCLQGLLEPSCPESGHGRFLGGGGAATRRRYPTKRPIKIRNDNYAKRT